MLSQWMRAWTGLRDLLIPATCVVCAEPVRAGPGEPDGICQACVDALPWNTGACPGCGLPAPGGGGQCRCRDLPDPVFDAVVAPLRYAAPVDRLVPRLKFHGDLVAGAQLSALLAMAVHDARRPDAVVPVPLHRSRLRQRGYDQALELARPVAKRLGVPLRAGLLRRRRATTAQTELHARQRQANVADAFEVRGAVPAHVALVDDVMTTGATLDACARALRAAGAVTVEAWVVARAARPTKR